ncbi:Omp28-related outer membrane protein [Capnocytophaga cynodegmi]|uniref:Omp28-related outer membrane protein n=1 Tax=Capnocytophaga cynodegmi TaxID=28189 RepID=UPI00385FF29E
MKKIFTFSLVAILVSFFVISCSKSDDSLGETERRGESTEQTPETGGGNQEDNNSGSNPNNPPTDNDNSQSNQSDKPFVYKVLVEDVTGTWCGYCPIATRSIQTAKNAQTPLKERFVVVAIHNRGGRRNEPMEIQKSYPLLSLFKILPNLDFEGFPFLVMNRDQQLPRGYTWVHIFECLEKTATSPLGIKISSQLNTTGGNVSVSFKTTENLEGLKYHIFVTQDNLIYSQLDYQQGGDDHNFKHDEVLRDIYGEVTGNALGTLTKGQEVTKANQQVSYKLLQHTDLDKVKVVVFVTNAAGAVVNVQEAKANQTKDYEYVK